MLISLYAKLAGLGLIVAMLGAGALYMHHKGYVSGKAHDAGVIAHVQQQLASDEAQIAWDAKTMAQVNADAAKAKSYADLQRSFAAAALQQVAADRVAMRAKESARRVAVTKAESTAACDTPLSAKLCAPLSSGY